MPLHLQIYYQIRFLTLHIILNNAMHCSASTSALYYITSQYNTLHYIVHKCRYYNAPHHTKLHCSSLHRTALFTQRHSRSNQTTPHTCIWSHNTSYQLYPPTWVTLAYDVIIHEAAHRHRTQRFQKTGPGQGYWEKGWGVGFWGAGPGRGRGWSRS